MKKGLLTMEKIRGFREVQGICPVCHGALKWNPHRKIYGQWAHFLRNTDFHIRHYGEEIISSKYNGIIVCDLGCNNAVQLTYASRPVLCDELAADIEALEERDKRESEAFEGGVLWIG